MFYTDSQDHNPHAFLHLCKVATPPHYAKSEDRSCCFFFFFFYELGVCVGAAHPVDTWPVCLPRDTAMTAEEVGTFTGETTLDLHHEHLFILQTNLKKNTDTYT